MGTKLGNKKSKPSHLRYIAEDHRSRNKFRRVLKFNGEAFAAMWKKKK